MGATIFVCKYRIDKDGKFLDRINFPLKIESLEETAVPLPKTTPTKDQYNLRFISEDEAGRYAYVYRMLVGHAYDDNFYRLLPLDVYEVAITKIMEQRRRNT